MQRLLGRTAVVCAALIVITGGFQGTAAPQDASHVIRLGAAISTTGSLAGAGKLTTDGYDFAVDWINAHGGVKINGVAYKLAPIKYYDDESKPAQSAALVEKLVTQDHITLILGPYSSDNTIAAAAITSKLGAVMMADEGVAKVIWTSGNKGVVGPIMYDYQYMYPVVDALLAKRTGIKTVVMLHADDSFSVGVAEGAAAYMKSKGLQVVGNFQYPSATTDVSSIIAQARPLNADVMMSSGHIEDAILITRQAKQNGLNFKALAFTVAPPTPDYVRALGRDAEYVIGPAPWLPQVNFTDPYFGNTQKFVEAFKAQRGYVPDYHVGDAAEGVELLVQGMVKAGSTDPGKVSAAFLNTTYATIAGFVHFDNNWHEDNQLGAAIQIQNEQPVPIWPAKYLTNLKFPMPTWSQR